MPKLFNQNLSKRDIQARVGNLSQICGPKSFTLADGKSKGVAATEIRTGGGLTYTVLPDLGMDIAWAEYRGIPIGFISKSGISSPEYYCPERNTWGSDFHGGLLTTCGLMQAGGSCVYKGRKHGTHGDVSNTPAINAGAFQRWEGELLKMGVQGTVRNGLLYRENLEMHRTITSKLGENTLHIHDQIENNGFERQPLMTLYHMNFGFPLVDRDTVLLVDAISQKPSAQTPEDAVVDCCKMGDPEPGAGGLVFFHDLKPDASGLVRAELYNPKLGWGIFIEWNKQALWNFAEWKNLSCGDYVVGLEPCNNYILGIAGEEENGTLEYIEPGETRTFDVTFGIIEEPTIQ